jgi:serine/threonine-protein kinase
MRPYFTSTGHLVFGTSEGQILAAPFDPEAMELTAAPVLLIEGVYNRTPGDVSFSLSDSGTLAYWLSPAALELTPMWVERDGTDREIHPGRIVLGASIPSSLALSPDGGRLAMSIVGLAGETHLWVKQLDTGPLLQVTSEGPTNRRPIWSSDSRWLTFTSDRAGRFEVWTKRADGSGTAEPVLDWGVSVFEVLYSPDTTWTVVRERNNAANSDILAIQPATDSVQRSLVATDSNEHSPAISPNGRWLAYVSDSAGRQQIYVSPFPDLGSSRDQVSTDGGTEPVWSHSGDELFYVNEAGQLVAAQVIADSSFVSERLEELFPLGNYLRGNGHPMYDVSPDDQRFVMLRIQAEGEGVELILVQNFFEELKERVPN